MMTYRRTASARRLMLAAAALWLAALTAHSHARGPQLTISLLDALTMYDAGEHASVVRALAAAAGRDGQALAALLRQDVPGWITADGPSEAPRRRLVAATFVLEVAHAGLDTQWETSRSVTEWACELLRSAGPPTGPERQWHLAALALLQASFEPGGRGGGESSPAVRAHLAHISRRFPGEPRIELARALLAEYDYWTLRMPGEWDQIDRNAPGDEPAAGRPIPALEAAAKHPANQAEASLRLGFLASRQGNLDRALAHLRAAAQGADDPTRVYLAHLFTGWTHEKAGRPDDAVAAYRRALATQLALSAALALAVRLYAIDERDEADTVVAQALAARPIVPDPWKAYGYGDFRRWPDLIARLRAAVLAR
jgi:tetratricopeptide (TPR) repeat protein